MHTEWLKDEWKWGRTSSLSISHHFSGDRSLFSRLMILAFWRLGLSVHLLQQELKCWAEIMAPLVATSLNSAVVLLTIDERTHFNAATELPHAV